MRTFDLAPLYRSTVGFDRLFSMLDGFEAAPGYPPYNIERTGENEYRITVAVAGFGENELSIEAKENTLTIKGAKQAKDEQNGEVLYQGIAARAFERVFQLADYVQVKARRARERIAARRSRARNPRGEEAAPDPDRQRQCQAAGDRDQGRGLTPRFNSQTAAPRISGALSFLTTDIRVQSVRSTRKRCRRRVAGRTRSAMSAGGMRRVIAGGGANSFSRLGLGIEPRRRTDRRRAFGRRRRRAQHRAARTGGGGGGACAARVSVRGAASLRGCGRGVTRRRRGRRNSPPTASSIGCAPARRARRAAEPG